MRPFSFGAFTFYVVAMGSLGIAATGTSAPVAAQANDYEQWKQTQQQQKQEFYQAYLSNYQAFKQRLEQHWGEQAELPSQEKFVDYSENLDEKVVIDYELGEIRIEMLVDPQSEPDENMVQRTLSRLETQSVGDTLAQAELTSGMRIVNDRKVLSTFAPEVSVADLAATAVAEEEALVVPPQTLSEPTANEVEQPKSAVEKRIKRYRIKISGDDIYQRRAQAYASSISAYASEYDVTPELVFAITQTESSFNPLAQSPIPAFGLMQIVPSSAGLDVNRLVFDVPGMPSESTLFDADQNIRMGTAYIHLLQSRYLRAITDPQSRLYCVIAAYNTGAGNVASVFHPQGSKQVAGAVSVINSLSADEVYQRLVNELPYQETRHYLQKVTSVLPNYRASAQ
ncbi:MAG: murein transglycosylase domain-containing protein [Idiomarina sp.]